MERDERMARENTEAGIALTREHRAKESRREADTSSANSECFQQEEKDHACSFL